MKRVRVFVLGESADTNIALNRFAFQSSWIYNNYASLAVDGNLTSCSHSSTSLPNPFWFVDLGNEQPVTTVRATCIRGHGKPVSWSQFRPIPDSARICRMWDRNGSRAGFSVVTNLVSDNNTSSIQII